MTLLLVSALYQRLGHTLVDVRWNEEGISRVAERG